MGPKGNINESLPGAGQPCSLEPDSLRPIGGPARNSLTGCGITAQLLWRLLVAFASWVGIGDGLGIGDAETTFLTPLD